MKMFSQPMISYRGQVVASLCSVAIFQLGCGLIIAAQQGLPGPHKIEDGAPQPFRVLVVTECQYLVQYEGAALPPGCGHAAAYLAKLLIGMLALSD